MDTALDEARFFFFFNVLCLVTESSPTLCDPMDCNPPGPSVHGDSPGKNTGVGCHALLQGIFPTQGSNPGLPHCRQILYHLSHQGSQLMAHANWKEFAKYRNTFKWMIVWYIDMAEMKLLKNHHGNFDEEHLLKYRIRIGSIGVFSLRYIYSNLILLAFKI